MNYELFMAEAIAEAKRGAAEGEEPIGSVAVIDDAMIARDHDRTGLNDDPTAHAVLLTLQAATGKLGARRLGELTIFTTHEPCAMCVGALLTADADGLVFAVPDATLGAAGSAVQLAGGNHLPQRLHVVSGIMRAEAAELLGSPAVGPTGRR